MCAVRVRWDDRVTLVPADMRNWHAPEQADIMVSELLGSFGDNELSPECLDGAQSCLKPDGISIPASYTSYLQPITTAKLWNDVKASYITSLPLWPMAAFTCSLSVDATCLLAVKVC